MGCDIHLIAQRREGDTWVRVDVAAFEDRTYGRFGFLAGVRNYSAVTPIAEPRGLPAGFTDDGDELGDHSFSWLTIAELSAFDYGQLMEDRRYTEQVSPGYWNGGATCEPGKGKTMTYREFLGDGYFEDLAELVAAGAERIVFGFDS